MCVIVDLVLIVWAGLMIWGAILLWKDFRKAPTVNKQEDL